MEPMLYKCRNKNCKRHDVLIGMDKVEGQQVLCNVCQRKMKRVKWGGHGEPNPIIEPQLQLPLPGSGQLSLLPAHYGGTDSHGCGYQALPPREPQNSDTWEVSREQLDIKAMGKEDGCPIYRQQKQNPKIELPSQLFNCWVWMAGALKTEWFAYLIGERIARQCMACKDVTAEGFHCPICNDSKQQLTDGWRITGHYFPEQVVTGAHAEVTSERDVREGVIGTVHSHVDMGAFFSGEDEKHWNHNVELVVNRRGEMSTCVRVELECGRFQRMPGAAVLTGNDFEEEELAKLKGVLKERQYEQPQRGYYGGMGEYQGPRGGQRTQTSGGSEQTIWSTTGAPIGKRRGRTQIGGGPIGMVEDRETIKAAVDEFYERQRERENVARDSRIAYLMGDFSD